MEQKKQILAIHGGTPFDTYEEYIAHLKSKDLTLDSINRKGWRNSLSNLLPEFEVICPQMPNSLNAKYLEWQIWFEKIIKLLSDDVILIGHSLGGIFLAKYLSENDFPYKIKSLHLVAAPYDTEHVEASLADFALVKDVSVINNKVGLIFIYQSKDDPEVSYHDAEKYKKDLPNAKMMMFEEKGHFLQEEFPELIQDIKNLK